MSCAPFKSENFENFFTEQTLLEQESNDRIINMQLEESINNNEN
jgi:hypothetical protein